MIRNSSPVPACIPDENVDNSATESSSSPIIAFVPDADRDDSPESDFSPIIDFTNDDIAAFDPDENMDDNSPNSDSSGEWWWPENQLGLRQDNLDRNGEIKHHETIAKN